MKADKKIRNYVTALCAVFVIISLIKVRAQDFAINTLDGLPDLGRGAVVWADFNNDGRLDVAMTGINSLGIKEAGVYINNGNNTFSNSGISLTPVSDGNLAVADFNNDGFIDLLLTGADANNVKIAKLYKNLGSNIFNALSNPLEGVAFGGASFIHLTNDGKSDVILCGVSNSNTRICAVYRNEGNDIFSLISTGITGASNGSLVVTDFNNDSYDDLLITGLSLGNSRINRLYINDGRGTFQVTGSVLPLIRSGGMASADFNLDGFADIFLSGNDSGGGNTARVYTNNAGAGFILVKSLPSIVDGGGAWGDFNHDGLPDLAMQGFNNPDLKSHVFTNVGGNDLVDSGHIFPGASNGTVTWVDYNNDNKLDLLQNGYAVSGPFNNLYNNNRPDANTPPGVPANLSYTAYADSVVLRWDAPVDNETSADGLSYDVYIGSTAGAMDILSSPSDKATGKRKIAAVGRTHGRTFTVKGLPEGTYSWSVQAIDPSFAASAFATEGTFVSCRDIAISGINTVCHNTQVHLNAGGSNDAVAWFSVSNPLATLGSSPNLVHTLTGKDTLYARVTKTLGCVLYDTVIVNVFSLPTVDLGSDKTACLNKTVSLKATTAAATIRWYGRSIPSATLGTGHTLQIQLKGDTTLVAEVKDGNLCINTDTITARLLPKPIVNLGADLQACVDSEVHFSTGTSSDSVNWFSQKRGLIVRASLTFNFSLREDDIIYADVYNSHKCISRDSVNVRAIPLPSADAGENKLICTGHPVTIGTPPIETGLRYRWEPSVSLSADNIPNPTANPVVNTQYVLRVLNSGDCENKDTVMVYINPTTIISTGGNKVICQGETTELGGHPTAMGSAFTCSFHWFPQAGLNNSTVANPQASPSITTTYGLQTKTGDCILDTSYVTVQVNRLPNIHAGEDIVAGNDEPVTLHATGGLSYQWFPEELFNDNTLADQTVSPNRTTTYLLHGTDINGCFGTDTVKVILQSELFVPSLFTPNQDQSNDTFRVHGFGIANITLKVYDRWGRLLFTSKNLEEGWDGRVNGREAEPGNYIWNVEGSYFDGNRLEYKGQTTGAFKLLR